ncbi:MAG: ATP-binding protein [Pseudomonadota bacterium]
MSSIRQRTLGLALLVFGASMLVIGFISYRYAAHEIEELHDASLAQSARLLEGLLQAPLPDSDRTLLLESVESALLSAEQSNHRFADHRYESKQAFQLWDGDRLLLRSASAPEIQLTQQPSGYSTLTVNQHDWRVFVLEITGTNKRVAVGEREDVRGELISAVALRTLLPDLIGLPLLTLLLWWSIGWGLAPLSRMAEQIRARDPHHLKPLTLHPLPQELETISSALNRLLEQLRQLRIREKRFIADAAHELRTPLAVLDLHAQNALTADNADDRKEALHHLRSGVKRSTRLVSQLLTLARLDHEEEPLSEYHRCNVLHEARETLAKLAPLAAERQQPLLLEADDSAKWEIEAEPGAIEALVQNLVGNAIQHSPAQSAITITLKALAKSVIVIVDDQGPGIPAAQRNQLMERFQRTGPGAGAGLGLSIVERLVKRHQGVLLLDEAPSGGLRVRATFTRNALSQRQPKNNRP